VKRVLEAIGAGVAGVVGSPVLVRTVRFLAGRVREATSRTFLLAGGGTAAVLWLAAHGAGGWSFAAVAGISVAALLSGAWEARSSEAIRAEVFRVLRDEVSKEA